MPDKEILFECEGSIYRVRVGKDDDPIGGMFVYTDKDEALGTLKRMQDKYNGGQKEIKPEQHVPSVRQLEMFKNYETAQENS